MTSLIAWAAADNKPTGMLISNISFASDSRLSWENAPPKEDYTKLYASDLRPEILGFAGEADLAQPVVEAFANEPAGAAQEAFDPHVRAEHLRMLLKNRVDAMRTCRSTSVLYGARSGLGVSHSVFSLFCLRWSQDIGSIEVEYVHIDPTQPSAVVAQDGSGTESIAMWQSRWRIPGGKHIAWQEPAGTKHFSRHIFSAFCDSINSNDDTATNGIPQIVRLRRVGNGEIIGFSGAVGTFVAGRPLSEYRGRPPVSFVDDNYHVVDQHGNRLGPLQPRPGDAPART